MGSLAHLRSLPPPLPPPGPAGRTLGLAAAILAAAGLVDWATGIELNVFPLYFAPVALVSWRLGRGPGLATAGASAAVWLGADLLGGHAGEGTGIAVVNALIEALAFAVVAWLVSRIRTALHRERTLARRDPLTRLDNALAFGDRAELEVARARRTGASVVLAYLDLDGMKRVNDARGHPAGDDVLRTVAGEIRRRCRQTDTAARLAGDEFALLLPDTDARGAEILLEELRVAIGAAMKVRGHDVTASVGAIAFPAAPVSVEAMVAAADEAMYEAKRGGRDRVVVKVAGAPAAHHTVTPG
jgi:diguanylate cyclase (GGDEF)-like protein